VIAEPDSRCPVALGLTWRERGAAEALGVVAPRGVFARVRELPVALDAGLRGVGLRVAIQQN
jgi:hypothetical protein